MKNRTQNVQHWFDKWFGLRSWTRHSLVLLIGGLVYIGLGVSYATGLPDNARIMALDLALEWMSFQGWGIVFILVGLMAVLSSRWPPFAETWGYMLLTGLASAWSMFYFLGVFFKSSPPINLTGALVWALIAFIWWAISGLISPERTVVNPRGSR